MSRAVRGSLRGIGLLAVLLLSAVFAGCAGSDVASQAEAVETIKANMLIQVEDTDSRWFRNVEVPKGSDAYQLTEAATGGDVNATFYPDLHAHFIEGILGTESAPPKYWLIWLWNDFDGKWEVLPVGADFYSVKDGQTFAWYYVDTTEEGKPPPATP